MMEANGQRVKLYIANASDRDTVLMILGRNGYTVRQGKGKKSPGDKTQTGFVEVVEDGKQ